MKQTILFNAFYVASALFLCFVNAALVSAIVIVDTNSTFVDGNYPMKELHIEVNGVALFWNTHSLRTEKKFVNNGIFYQTCSLNPAEYEVASKEPAFSWIQFSNRFMNNESFIYEYSEAWTQPQFVAFAKRIVNLGKMWFSINGRLKGPLGDPPDVWFQAQRHFRYLGYLEVSGTRHHTSSLKITTGATQNPDSKSTVMVNRGHIVLRHADWDLRTNIKGNGCISLEDGASLHLDDRITYPKNQKILFNVQSIRAILYIDVHEEGPTRFAKILSGFSRGCYIGFNQDMRNVGYNKAGHLHAYSEAWPKAIILQIGRGYDPLKFVWGKQAIYYKEDAPRITPQKCQRESNEQLMQPYWYPEGYPNCPFFLH